MTNITTQTAMSAAVSASNSRKASKDSDDSGT
jgi:hypothetical protein